MKSREGTVVDADDLLKKMEGLARVEIKKRNKNINKWELDKRAKTISLAALKFYILNVNPATKIKFNPKESISFTGKTGPYLLYSYARLRSILRKGKIKDSCSESMDYSLAGGDAAWNLIWELAKFPEAVLSAMEGMDPEEISAYLYNLSTKISDFYHKVPVLEAGPREKQARVAVIVSALAVLGLGLSILGIKPLEEM
jgi:arginyl-tRNA synthetase